MASLTQPTAPFEGITLLGLGPGGPELLTRQAWDVLAQAPRLLLRTVRHPVVAGLPQGAAFSSCDDLYAAGEAFETVYEQIVARVLAAAALPGGVVYAVPGHPFVAESTGPEIARQARAAGIPVRVVEGLSFLEPSFTALGLDPFPKTVLLDAFDLARAHHPPFPPDVPALIAQVYSRSMASEVKLTLMAVYPDTHPVRLLHAAGTPEERVEDLPLYAIDRSEFTGLLTSLYVPPLEGQPSFEALQEIIAHLRAPDGCPWDQKQTLLSLRTHLLEETYEALAALDAEDPDKTCEELGDILLITTMLSQVASEDGEFSMAEVLQGINAKLIRRHPHVFSDTEIKNVEDVVRNWDRLKAEERKNSPEPEKGILDGVPLALPALVQSKEIQSRVSRVGFDWPDISGVYAKIHEEIEEVRTAEDALALAKEIGDLLFAVVRLADWLKVDAETALRETNLRFKKRFGHLESAARRAGRELASFSPAEMDALWEEAKTLE